MIVYFADRQFNILGQASTELPKGLIVDNDKKTEEVETGIAVFECNILFDAETRAMAKRLTAPGNYLLRSNGKESELFSITDRETDSKKQQMYIYAEDDGLDLLNEVVGSYTADQTYAIDHYINKYAAGAGFEIGINEAVGLTRKLSWDSESTASARIASIAAQFGDCEVSYSFEVSGLNVVKKYVNIYKERGKDIGIQLRLNRDIDSIVTTESIVNLATALHVTGGTSDNADKPVTLLGYQYDDGDFYVDGAVLKSRTAFEKWHRLILGNQEGGHITKPFSSQATSQAVLCEEAIAQLKKYRDMEVNYEADFKELPDNVKVGDRISVIDDAGELYVSTRLLKLETSVVNKEYKVTLGEHLIKTSGIHQKVAELAAQFAKTTISVQVALNIANVAQTAAKAAQTIADAASAVASNAQVVADEAKAEADTATQAAAQATEKANAAQAAVDVVEESVSSLQTTVENAQAAADNAQAAAGTATEKAEEAKTAADKALEDAADAKTAAETAQGAADSAIAKAATAEETAATAKADAETAQATAAAAKADAEQANEDIAALGENLETVRTTMETDYARKTALTESEARLQSQISQNSAEISSTVSRLSTVDETANNAAALAAQAQSGAAAAQAQADQAATDAQAAQKAADDAATAAANAQSEADTAKTAAETAKSVANKAQADLEAAQADLATVSGRVDVTEEEIATAQQAVVDAKAAADKAKEDAASAATKAADAQTTADTAVTNAATAQSAADDAASKAALAQATADAAKGDASAAQAKANEAAQAAAAAQETANTATTNAANAQATADAAAQAASDAQKAADDADAKAAQAATDLATAQQNLADVTSRVDATEDEVAAAQEAVETAQAAANKAKADAVAAQATADTAKADAATAQTAANNAKTAADNAQAAAEEAQEAAAAAKADVDALAVVVTEQGTAITQKADKIELEAYKTEVTNTLGGYYTKEQTDAAIKVSSDNITSSVRTEITEAVDDIEIGGRNLLKMSDLTASGAMTIDGYVCHFTKASGSTYAGVLVHQSLFTEAKYFVLSYKFKKTGGTLLNIGGHGGATTPIAFYVDGVKLDVSYSAGWNVPDDTAVHTVEYHFIGGASNNTPQIYIQPNRGKTSFVSCDIWDIKLERGTKATDWTPSEEESEAALYDKVNSKGEQLVTNGNGLLGNNTNFSRWEYDGAVANSSSGSFTKTQEGTRYNVIAIDDFLPVNAAKEYTLSFDVKSKNGIASLYSMLIFYDADKQAIQSGNHMFVSGTTTTLAQDLKSGDTVIYLTDASGWSTTAGYGFYMLLWNYKNSYGYTYPAETYTRNRLELPRSSDNKLVSTCLDKTANTITLTTPYSGETIPEGTEVTQGREGATYKYIGASNNVIPTEWTSYSGKVTGLDFSGGNKGGMFPPGTAYAKVGFNWNYNKAADQLWLTNVSVTDTTEVSVAQSTADEARTTANDASSRISAAESTIRQLAEAISMLVVDGSGTTLLEQTAGGWSFNIGGALDSLKATAEGLAELEGSVENTDTAVSLLQSAVAALEKNSDYIRIITYNGQPCIELGEAENEFKVRITNTEIQFADGTVIPAYISNQKLNIEQAEIKNELQIGGFVLKKRDNGNVGFIWKGVNN